jgi:hypothetical protein
MIMGYRDMDPFEIIRHRDKAVNHYNEEIKKSAFVSAAVAALGPTASAAILVAGGAAALAPVTGPLILAGMAAATVATGIMKFLDDRQYLKKRVDVYDAPIYKQLIGEGEVKFAENSLQKAEKILNKIEKHQAIQQYQEMKGMPERAKALYADAMLRNNPDLARSYGDFKKEMSKAHESMVTANKQGVFDPQNASTMQSLLARATSLPKIDDKADGGLFNKIKSFISDRLSDNSSKPVYKM